MIIAKAGIMWLEADIKKWVKEEIIIAFWKVRGS